MENFHVKLQFSGHHDRLANGTRGLGHRNIRPVAVLHVASEQLFRLEDLVANRTFSRSKLVDVSHVLLQPFDAFLTDRAAHRLLDKTRI